MSIRTISSVAARSLAGFFSIWVSFTGTGILLLTLSSPHLSSNLSYLFLNGIELMIEAPVVLMSLRFHRVSVAILWLLFLVRVAIMIGYMWSCLSMPRCIIPDVSYMLIFRVRIVRLTFATAFMAQLGYILRKPSGASAPSFGDPLNYE